MVVVLEKRYRVIYRVDFIVRPFRFYLILITLLVYIILSYLIRKRGGPKGRMWIFSLPLVLLIYFSTRNIITFYIIIEFSLLPIIIVVLRVGSYPERYQAVLYFFLYTAVRSFPVLIIIIWYRNTLGRTSVIFIQFSDLKRYLIPILFIGFIVKLPLYGIHSWLPKAHVQAPVHGSMLLAGVILKLGGYGLYFLLPLVTWEKRRFIIFSLVIFSLWGGVLSIMYCIRIRDIKVIIAYSSVGHISLVLPVLLVNNSLSIFTAVVIIVGHGFSSPLIFYMADKYYRISNTRNLTYNRGITKILPLLYWFFVLSLVLNIAFPPTINFFGELFARMRLVVLKPSNILFIFIIVLVGGRFNVYLIIQLKKRTSIRWLNASSRLIINNICIIIFLTLLIYIIITIIHL